MSWDERAGALQPPRIAAITLIVWNRNANKPKNRSVAEP